MSDDLTPDERRVAEMLSSVGAPRHRRVAPREGPRPIRWLALAGVAALVVAIAASAVVLPGALGRPPGHRETPPAVSRSTVPKVSPSITPGVQAEYAGAGARMDAAQDLWLVGQTSLAVSRDGGTTWNRLPLPPGATASDIYAISVLPTETVVVTSVVPLDAVTISTFTTGQSQWHWQTVSVGAGQVGTVQIVDSSGTLEGLMIVLTTSSNFSEGAWLGTPDGGATWQVRSAPVGGVVTAAGGELWLVGGAANQDVYVTSDNSASWQLVDVPVTVGTEVAYGPVQASGSGIVLTANLANTDEIQVVTGNATKSGWQWTPGPIVGLGGQYGVGGTASSSVADGVLWLVGWTGTVARVTLATGSVLKADAVGLPSSGSDLVVSASSSLAAVASYSMYVCVTTGCAMQAGMVATSDGGSLWIPVPDPFMGTS
ncbi:MAG: hypothetical protein WB116_00510 [Candidatus Dormiibacterota bacterium]